VCTGCRRAACLVAVAEAAGCPGVPPELVLPDGSAVLGSLDLCNVRALDGEVLIGKGRRLARIRSSRCRLDTYQTASG